MRKDALAGIIVFVLLTGGAVAPQVAYANQLDALMLPDRDASGIHLTAFRTIELRYPAGSTLAAMLDGANERKEFVANGSSVQGLVDAINRAIREGQKSPVVVENVTLSYVATVKGQQDRAQVAVKVDIKGDIKGYVLQKEVPGNRSAIVDLDWRNFVVDGPVMVSAADEDGGAVVVVATAAKTIDINTPQGALQAVMPQLADKLQGAEKIMRDPILDFSRFNLPMKSWHYLFDVTGAQLKNYNVFREGEGGTVSIHSIGESSFREGTYLPKEVDAEIQVDGAQVKMHASTPAPSGQITIAGYSKVQESGGTEYAEVSSRHAGVADPLGFQFQVLMVLAGMMGAVAVFVLYRARS
ncbi:hypothetical protein [Nitrososphaera sp.]|uniref:hypothetical protein n=1 Tax=Nitrososphaera sp. TaxID=1971748 RepID=UPI00307FBF05